MVRIIPEKTVELWTALTLIDSLGPDTWIWSQTEGIDQDVWTPDLKKWFVLELKAPETPRHGKDAGTKIDLKQLESYVSGFNRRKHPDVLYVLPDPPWRGKFSIGRIPPLTAHPQVRRSFGSWAYVVPATILQRLIDPKGTKTATVYCTPNMVEYRPRGSGVARNLTAPTLHTFLTQIRLCIEPRGMALRSKNTRYVNLARPRRALWRLNTNTDFGKERGDDSEDLLLDQDSLGTAVHSLSETQSAHRLLIGW